MKTCDKDSKDFPLGLSVDASAVGKDLLKHWIRFLNPAGINGGMLDGLMERYYQVKPFQSSDCMRDYTIKTKYCGCNREFKRFLEMICDFYNLKEDQ